MTLSHLTTKFAGSVADDGTFSGYGSTFGNVDQGGDVVVRGAFTKSLATRSTSQVRMLFQHDPSQPIGVWTNLVEDERGLKAEGRLILESGRAREVHALMKGGALDGLSIGFMCNEATFDKATGARLLKQLDLREISVVTFPMNEQATIAAVKGEEMTEREFERLLRDAGLPKEFAKTVTLHGFKRAQELYGRDRRDAGEGDHAAIEAAIRAMAALR